jgi:hypothetical protein
MGSDGSKQYQLIVNETDPTDLPPFVNASYQGRGVQAVWYDSMLTADCVFYGAEDGKLRCLPGSRTPPGSTYGVVFADSQCSQALLTMPSTAFGCSAFPTPAYVRAAWRGTYAATS